jgi:hypothetical protein
MLAYGHPIVSVRWLAAWIGPDLPLCDCVWLLSFSFLSFFPTRTMETQQLSSAEDAALPDGPAYNFQRKTSQPTDTLNHGTGWPAAHTGAYVSLS